MTMTMALGLALGAALTTGCLPKTDSKVTGPTNCAGKYWLIANGSALWLELTTDSTGAGVQAVGADGSEWFAGKCAPVLPNTEGSIELTRTFAGQNYVQNYTGHFRVDSQTGQIALSGHFTDGAGDYDFLGFTLFDSDAPKMVDAPDAIRIRQAALNYIWNTGLPLSKLVDEILPNVPAPTAGLGGELEHVDEYVIKMEEGFTSHAFHLYPAHPRGHLMIYHAGHADDVGGNGGGAAISGLLKAGYDVIALGMPAYGPNDNPKGPKYDHRSIMISSFSGRTYSPLKFFLEPIAVSLNQALKDGHFGVVGMLGISGGGWSTVLYAALDPRIQISFPVAGSVPIGDRQDPADLGDHEQFLPEFYEIADYSDLYVLGAYGPGRVMIAVHNEFDNCCFARAEPPAYVAKVKAKLASLGMAGSYDLKIDMGQVDHMISPWTMSQVVLPALSAFETSH